MSKNRHTPFLIALLLIAACSTPFQGIRFRAQGPAIDDGFRKISLAVQTDDYSIEQIDPANYTLLTAWRDLKSEELDDAERRLPAHSVQGAIRIRFEQRGRSYEVYATPLLRRRIGETWQEAPADVHHPLWTRWHQLLTRLLEREVSDGD